MAGRHFNSQFQNCVKTRTCIDWTADRCAKVSSRYFPCSRADWQTAHPVRCFSCAYPLISSLTPEYATPALVEQPFSKGQVSKRATTYHHRSIMDAMRHAVNAPFRSLTILFVAWELLLLTVALLTSAPGYDTSAHLLFRGYGVETVVRLPPLEETSLLERSLQKLTRWDAIYFASIAERGYLLEQEWAFGWGFTRLLAFLAECE